MNKLKEFLQGKKTYLAGIATILSCIIAWVNGANLDWNLIITALMGMFIRAGVSKNLSGGSSQ